MREVNRSLSPVHQVRKDLKSELKQSNQALNSIQLQLFLYSFFRTVLSVVRWICNRDAMSSIPAATLDNTPMRDLCVIHTYV